MNERKTKITEADIQIGRNLRTMRESAKISQKDLARILGVTFQQLQKYETAKNRLPAAKLFTLGRFFEVPYENFFHGIDGIKAPCMKRLDSDPLTAKIVYKVRAVQDPATKHQIGRMIDVMLSAPTEKELS